jgi:hypothetical protein
MNLQAQQTVGLVASKETLSFLTYGEKFKLSSLVLICSKFSNSPAPLKLSSVGQFDFVSNCDFCSDLKTSLIFDECFPSETKRWIFDGEKVANSSKDAMKNFSLLSTLKESISRDAA